MSRAQHGCMTRPKAQPRSSPVRSYILRLVELRSTDVRVVYELHEIGGGAPRRFGSPEALRRFLAEDGSAQAGAAP